MDVQRLAAINQQLQQRAAAQETLPGREALIGIQSDGSHLTSNRFDQELFELLTSSKLVQEVKRVSGLKNVRPFQFDLLTKAPGGPGTPWHRDRDFLPIDRQSFTCWIPLDPIPAHCTLVYAEGTACLPPTQSDAQDQISLRHLLRRHGAPLCQLPAMEPGDIDIHEGQVWHYGPANKSPHWRRALGVAFIADDTRLCLNPPGFCGPSGAGMRSSTLTSLFGTNAEGTLVRGERHPLL